MQGKATKSWRSTAYIQGIKLEFQCTDTRRRSSRSQGRTACDTGQIFWSQFWCTCNGERRFFITRCNWSLEATNSVHGRCAWLYGLILHLFRCMSSQLFEIELGFSGKLIANLDGSIQSSRRLGGDTDRWCK